LKFTQYLLIYILTSCSFGVCAQTVSDLLPEGTAPTPQVVHRIKYPLESRWTIKPAFINYYGNRLAKTFGLGIELRRFTTEKSYWSTQLSLYRSELVSQVSGDSFNLQVTDPKQSLSFQYGSFPIYGKYSLNEKIQHFRAGFSLGAAATQMKSLVGNGNIQGRWIPEIQAGLQLLLQLDESWTLEGFTQLSYRNLRQENYGWLYGIGTGVLF